MQLAFVKNKPTTKNKGMQIKARALWMLERLSSDNTLTEDVQCSLIYGLVLFFYTEGFFSFCFGFYGTPVFKPVELAVTTLKL